MASAWQPGYVRLHHSGELKQRAEQAYGRLVACDLCYRACGVDRSQEPAGFCRAGPAPVVASWTAHMGEEPPLSGSSGSGTIFLTHCTAKCSFCQNFSISQMSVGREVTVERLAWMMLSLQKRGCHNVNFVTPTHYTAPILAALDVAAGQGLCIPVVWNTNGYDSLAALRLLDGVVDIYLPDAKYAENRAALRLSGMPTYVEANRACLKEMYRQVGDELALDEQGMARRGLIIRHLVLPGNLAQSADVLAWIGHELSPNVHVSLLSQYFPSHRAFDHPLLARRLNDDEWEAALDAFDAAGLNNGWGQNSDS